MEIKIISKLPPIHTHNGMSYNPPTPGAPKVTFVNCSLAIDGTKIPIKDLSVVEQFFKATSS